MLANVVIGTSLRIDPRETLETSVRHVFLVQTPADALVLEQIDNSGDILGNLSEWVAVETEVITDIESANEKYFNSF